jgi:hypothetical protein
LRSGLLLSWQTKGASRTEIKELDPDASIIWGSVERFEKQLEKLEQRKNIVEIMKADEKDGLYESNIRI